VAPPRSSGVWYDESHDRSLFAPGVTKGAPGAEIVFDETIDRNPNRLDVGGVTVAQNTTDDIGRTFRLMC
jgi:hypothetical protein